MLKITQNFDLEPLIFAFMKLKFSPSCPPQGVLHAYVLVLKDGTVVVSHQERACEEEEQHFDTTVELWEL